MVVESEAAAASSSHDLEIGISSRDTTARDVMLPPDRYPRIPGWATIREAMVALTASAVRFEDGHIMMPRYLLVLDEEDQLVGIVSRRELVRGLLPQLREAERSRAQIRKLVGFGGRRRLRSRFAGPRCSHARRSRAANDPVSTVMTPVKGSVRLEDSLSTVITTMLHHGIDLVPVLDGRKVAGVVLMTNIFDIVAQFILDRAAEPLSDRRLQPRGSEWLNPDRPQLASLGGKHSAPSSSCNDRRRTSTAHTRLFFILLGLALFVGVYYSPQSPDAIDPMGEHFQLSHQGKAALALFLIAAVWWVFEVVPIGVTSIAIGVHPGTVPDSPGRDVRGRAGCRQGQARLQGVLPPLGVVHLRFGGHRHGLHQDRPDQANGLPNAGRGRRAHVDDPARLLRHDGGADPGHGPRCCRGDDLPAAGRDLPVV